VNLAQYYCTIAELDDDLKLRGAEKIAVQLRAVRDASMFLRGKMGEFIPVTESRYFTGRGVPRLYVQPLLAITAISNDGTSLASSDYILKPSGAHWRNGPYTYLEVDPDAASLSEWATELDSVEITGRWGLFEQTTASGAVVGTGGQTNSATSLLVDDGSKLSPGAVAYIGTEQELVTGYSTPTAAVTTLNGAVTLQQDTITLADGTKVKAGEIIRVEFELMRVEEIQTNSVAVSRGWFGTNRVAHNTGVSVDAYRTFTVDRGANGTTAAAHNAAVAISVFQIPPDVNYLARQIAALMLKKASSGFAGKSGNSELGEVYYTNEFPRGAMNEVLANYDIPRFA